jgi:hypothetical protein
MHLEILMLARLARLGPLALLAVLIACGDAEAFGRRQSSSSCCTIVHPCPPCPPAIPTGVDCVCNHTK